MKSFIFLSLCFGLSLSAKAFDVPSLTGPVVDQVGILSAGALQNLNQTLFQAHQNQGPQVQVLIVESLQGESIDQVATQVYDKWKLGDAKLSNGALLLVAIKDKKLRIEVGRGLEGDIPDAIAKRIVMDTISPYFKRGEFELGIQQGVASILHYAGVASGNTQADSVQPVADQETSGRSGLGTGSIYFIMFIIWILLLIFKPSMALALLFAGRGGGGRGGGGWSGGSGGWSGGGGSSAGGGASGDW